MHSPSNTCQLRFRRQRRSGVQTGDVSNIHQRDRQQHTHDTNSSRTCRTSMCSPSVFEASASERPKGSDVFVAVGSITEPIDMRHSTHTGRWRRSPRRDTKESRPSKPLRSLTRDLTPTAQLTLAPATEGLVGGLQPETGAEVSSGRSSLTRKPAPFAVARATQPPHLPGKVWNASARLFP